MLEERIKRKLTENITWYKENNKKREEDDAERKEEADKETSKWKPWRKRKRRKFKGCKRENEKGGEKERREREEEGEVIRGVFFVPHTENSQLAKRIREKLRSFEEISLIRVKLVERTGEKLENILHKSNPWEATDCKRDDCAFCTNEKLIGKCKTQNILCMKQNA